MSQRRRDERTGWLAGWREGREGMDGWADGVGADEDDELRKGGASASVLGRRVTGQPCCTATTPRSVLHWFVAGTLILSV